MSHVDFKSENPVFTCLQPGDTFRFTDRDFLNMFPRHVELYATEITTLKMGLMYAVVSSRLVVDVKPYVEMVILCPDIEHTLLMATGPIVVLKFSC